MGEEREERKMIMRQKKKHWLKKMRKKGKEEKEEGKGEIERTEYRKGRKRNGNMSKNMSRSI